MASVFADTQLSSTWNWKSQVFEIFGRILYFTLKLFISMPRFLFGIKLTSTITLRQKKKKKKCSGTSVSVFFLIIRRLQLTFSTGYKNLGNPLRAHVRTNFFNFFFFFVQKPPCRLLHVIMGHSIHWTVSASILHKIRFIAWGFYRCRSGTLASHQSFRDTRYLNINPG
jgi:hypothetical protein